MERFERCGEDIWLAEIVNLGSEARMNPHPGTGMAGNMDRRRSARESDVMNNFRGC